MGNYQFVIQDSRVLASRHLLHDGFVFTSITFPANIYDTIVIKHPHNVQCRSPRIAGSLRSLQDHIDFINRHEIEKALIIADNIDFITQCPSLKYLRIIPADDAGNGFDYSPLYEMPIIKSLQCATVYGAKEEFSTCVDCSKLKGLESIHVTDDGKINYRNVATLKDLGFTNYRMPDLSNAFNSSVLDTLTVMQSQIKSLEGIQKSNKMQCLYLYGNRSLQDIGALRNVKKTLRALRIENCPKINDFSVLSELGNLELLELSGSNTLPNLNFLRSMKSLKTFTFSMNVLDGDLSLCLGLSYVYSERNRKHYNLKDAALPKGKYVRGNEDIDEWRRSE